MNLSRLTLLALCGLLSAGIALPLRADMPEIQKATAERVGMGWRINVTLKHPDTGWDHYADGWDVHDASGKKIGFRELMHPHVDEQPFTRALVNIMLPDGTREIFIRARCSVAGWSSEQVKVTLKN
jgi:hypothetical protein